MKLIVTDVAGKLHELEVETEQVLMRVLREMPSGVSAICGGVMACGTCHVYVEPGCLSMFPEPSTTERGVLEALKSFRVNSRLSCQLYLRPDCTELKIAIAPSE